MKRILLLITSLVYVFELNAQELNCTVTINSDQVQGSNKEMFNTLKQSIEEFVNTSRWTTTLASKLAINYTILYTLHY